MKIVFAGTPEIAVPTLEYLFNDDNIEICAVITNCDKPVGRGKIIEPPPVKKKALELGIKVWQPEKFDLNFHDYIRYYNADLLVVFAYGQILKPSFLNLFKYGGVNVHPSLLPLYRGASPIQSVILSRDDMSGITIQTMSEKMDCGDILYRETFLLNKHETTETLTTFVASMAPNLVLKVINDFESHYKLKIKQDDNEATYCKKITRDDALINWNEDASIIDAKIRAFNPWPKAYTFFNSIELYILDSEVIDVSLYQEKFNIAKVGEVFFYDKKKGFFVKCSSGILCLKMLQLKARKLLDWSSFKNGNSNFLNSVLGV